MKRTFLAALVMFSSFAAMATPGGEGNNSGCNGVGNANSPCTGTGNGGAGGNGGQGGQGGAGGKATAQARAEARANAIAAQQQAQSQTSRNTNKNTNTVKTNVTGGAVNVSVSLPAGTVSTEKSGTPADTVKEMPAAQKSDTVVVDNQTTRYPVSTAYAAPLAASNGTCLGSSSAGVQGASFGVSVASTMEDKGCDRRYDAAALLQLGLRDAAIARLCQGEDNRKAMEEAGAPCPNKKTAAKRAESILNGETVTQRQPLPYMAGG